MRGGGLGAWLSRAAPRRARGAVVIALVGDAAMRRLNREYRGLDYATDVLSFRVHEQAAGAAGGKVARRQRPDASSLQPLGDIAIALGVARRQARAHGHTVGTELRILGLHGILHLLGYDHEADRGHMRQLEERLRRRAGLPAGLIGRRPGRADRR